MPLTARLPSNSRILLLAGFGGLLLLMLLAALDDIRNIRSIETRSDAVRNSFLERDRLLNRIRSDLYLSGTCVRDYILEPDRAKAEPQRVNFERTRDSLAAALNQFRAMMRPADQTAFADLTRELNEYWSAIASGMARQPGASGYAFLRDEIYPRRTDAIAIVDRISSIGQHDLNTRILQVTELFAGFRERVAITMLIALGIGAALAFFTGRRILQYEREAGAHLRDIEHARSELKELSTRLVEAQESERRAISRELHDEVGQSLSALLVSLGNAVAETGAAPSPRLAESRQLAEASLRCVRNIALLLRPSMLDDLGLLPALQWQAREVSKRSAMSVTIDAEGVPEELPDEYRTAIYRVVQEALHNSEQHARASIARVTMRAHAGILAISVQDDGRGFDPEFTRGMGILGMQERVANLHGAFNIESESHGTLVTVRLPLPS